MDGADTRKTVVYYIISTGIPIYGPGIKTAGFTGFLRTVAVPSSTGVRNALRAQQISGNLIMQVPDHLTDLSLSLVPGFSSLHSTYLCRAPCYVPIQANKGGHLFMYWGDAPH